jgi:CheY-like chemotaxis protein
VLLNLLSNAGRFTEEGGVTVRVRQDGLFLLFSVSDTGPGITEEDQQRLFQPFQQLDNSIRRRHGGTGLGLSISKSFIELHDGKMWVESEKGQGTTFSFRLPLEPISPLPTTVNRWINPYISYQAVERPPRSAALPLVDSRPRLLVIEKGSVLQRLLKRYLPQVEIVSVASLEAAHAAMDHSPARAVLLNDMEPTISISELSSVSWLPPSTPVITCAIAEQIQYAPGPDIPEILVKPITRDVLLGSLEKLDRPIHNILLVDDELDAQKLFVRMLTSANRGYQVQRAGNGLQALELLRRQKVDVILLDLVMPEMDGFQFLKIKEQDSAIRNIPVILISARDPRGQPIVSNYLAATRGGGLSVQQLLDCIQALNAILAPDGLSAAAKPAAESPG